MSASRPNPNASESNSYTPRSVAMIGSYVPRKCGIATFTHDLSTSISEHVFHHPLSESANVGICAMNDVPEGYDYPPQVVFEIRHHSKEDYRAAADFLNQSKYEIVCIQHEYGIFGGNDGEYILALVDRLDKPFVLTAHTVLQEPSPGQLRVLRELTERSGRIVVMAQRAYSMLGDVFGISDDRIEMIHHGVPDVPFGDTEPLKKRFGVSGRPTILTFGLLSSNKGIELMLDALARVVPKHPDVAYIVLGATHPAVRRESGESYRLSLENRAVKHRIENNVIFHNRYVSLEDLCEYLRATDIYVTPYRNRQQIVSGTLAYASACGTAVVSTPYWYAEEILADGRGILVDFDNVDGLAAHLDDLLTHEDRRMELRKNAYEFGRQMIWANVSKEYARVFDQVCEAESSSKSKTITIKKPIMRLSLPEVHLDHLHRMSDDTGLTQHAIHATPDRRHGYSIDDVSRGLIVAAMRYTLLKGDDVLQLFHTYLSYIHYARNEAGRYRNFMSYDRRWIDTEGDDDSQGRVAWALGYVVKHAPDELSRELCTELFRSAAPLFDEIEYIRPSCFAILGCHYFLQHEPNADDVVSHMRKRADEIATAIESHESEDWHWFSDLVTYENGRIPQALILAGLYFKDDRLLNLGCRVLDWLLKVQTGEGGQISLIGNDGWLRKGHPKPMFDQQPVEVAALVGACKAAFRATDDRKYLAEMRRCFDWFLGSNDLGVSMIDFKSRGCFDGLTPSGVNANQGAESLLAWLLSLLIMHEIQTGDPASAG